ncbi:hypothetical protein P0D88_31465 [Paraburkholderia sp. RL18-103-BIB-C]|uniref:phage tail tube protein n=1 Tax=Paraburkholderia sp. RL18-103-BIB-C TaxID=3031637 RepID=UPI0038B9F727
MKKAISAQNTKMFLENPNAAPIASGTLTSASLSEPCIVVFNDASKVANGEPIYITGSGWPSLDNQEWVVQNLDKTAKAASLANSNTSDETAAWKPDAAWTLNAFADVCAHAYAINQNPATSIDTTTLCDDEKTFLVGFRDPGTLTFDFYIDPTDPNYLALMEAYDDGEARMFEIIYRNGAVRTLPGGAWRGHAEDHRPADPHAADQYRTAALCAHDRHRAHDRRQSPDRDAHAHGKRRTCDLVRRGLGRWHGGRNGPRWHVDDGSHLCHRGCFQWHGHAGPSRSAR